MTSASGTSSSGDRDSDFASFGIAAPLAEVLTRACATLDKETAMIAGRSAMSDLQQVAAEKQDLLSQHDRWVESIGEPQRYAASLSPVVRVKLKALYARFAQALAENKRRLSAAVEVSQALLLQLSQAAGSAQPSLYTRAARLSEAPSASVIPVKEI